jgi:hypothetical protein
MRQGAGPALALFAVVLAVTGGLGWLLYEAGDESGRTAPEGTAAPKPAHPGRGPRTAPEPAPAEPRDALPPNLRFPPPGPRSGPRIPVEGHDDLKLHDWKDVASAIEDARAVSRENLEKGPPQPGDDARMQAMQRRMEHFIAAVVMPRTPPDVPSTTPQHPAFVVNTVAALLDRANLPLTDAQVRRLADLAKERGPVADAADAEVKKDDPGGWTIRRVAARAALGDVFFADVDAVLTPAQQEVVAPSDLRGRLHLDIVSSAGAWGRIACPLFFSDEKQLTDMLAAGVAAQFGIAERTDEIRPVVEAWVRDSAFDAADALDVKGYLRTSRIAPAVERTIDLFTRVADALKLPPETAAQAHATPQAWIPLRR